jgi:hypothetical protein
VESCKYLGSKVVTDRRNYIKNKKCRKILLIGEEHTLEVGIAEEGENMSI